MVNIMELGLAANAIAKGVMWLINAIFEGVGNYGVAVILFTLILKAAMSPLDVWQKAVMTKNNRAMERMKPQLEKLQKQYANNKELYSQKQMELYRKEKYSMLGSCLPTILSLVIFILVFSGFNGMIRQYNEDMFTSMQTAYYDTYDAAAGDDAAKKAAAEQAVVNTFDNEYKSQTRFLWISNVFMPDGWKQPIPDYETFSGTGMGKLNIQMEIKDGITGYEKVMSPLIAKYNGEKGKKWNGYLILPVIAALITFASGKLMKQAQPPSAPGQGENMQNAMQANMKMMQYFMPIMLGVLAMFYSTAFSIYMIISNIFSTVFQLVYNLFVKKQDKRLEEKRLETTYK